MTPTKPPSIFISLTHSDAAIAEALKTALQALLGEDTEVAFSTDRKGSGPAHGENWFQWIVKQVRSCDFALVLITPASVQKPWIQWEAGAVYGAAVAAEQESMRKVRPLLYGLRSGDVPSPILESQVQLLRGDDPVDVESFFTDILQQYRDVLGQKIITASKRLARILQDYMAAVEEGLRLAPMVADNNVIEEWRHRLDDLLNHKRASEADHLHQWLDIAFGRERADHPQPLDLRIHTKLADLYLKSKKYKKAVDQLELARKLAPRDIFVLRTLGRAYLENDQVDEAKTIIDAIKKLDEKAIVNNVECAALSARWQRANNNLKSAAGILETALENCRDSYYLANLLAEVRLDAKDPAGAGDAFGKVKDIITRMGEQNVWTHASLANAEFFSGDDEAARQHLEEVKKTNPDPDTATTIREGIERLAVQVKDGEARVAALVKILRP